VDQREEIRRAYYVDGKSIRRIAREGHHDRRTVRKALRDAGPPRYTLQQPRARPILGPYVELIDRWLEEDLSQPPKQRHTARRIYCRLVEEHGFVGGESTIREYVRKTRFRGRSLFIPLAYEPGQDAQCDFGEVWIVLGGWRITAQALCMRLCFSKIPFVMVFPHQRQEAFLRTLSAHRETRQELHADLGVGRYLWAMYGFSFQEKERAPGMASFNPFSRCLGRMSQQATTSIPGVCFKI